MPDPTPGDARPWLPTPSPRHLAWLLLATVPIALLAQACHDILLTRLGVPYPFDPHVPSAVKALNQVARLGGLVILCRYADGFLRARSAVAGALIVGLVNVCISETLRVIAIEKAIFGGGWGKSFAHVLTDHLPMALLLLFQGAAAALIARPLGPGRWRGQGRGPGRNLAWPLLAVVGGALVGWYGLLPAVKAAMAWLDTRLGIPEPVELYTPPYTFHIYKYIYGWFLEPTLACLLLARMVWPGLPGGRWRRVGLFTLLVLLARGRLTTTFVNAFWLDFPLPVALAAEGQFLLETLAMAALVGWAWSALGARDLDPVPVPLRNGSDHPGGR